MRGGSEEHGVSDHERAFRLGNFEDALAFADRALMKNPENVSAALTRIRVNDALFHDESAEAEYARVAAASLNSPAVLAILPELSFAQRRRALMDRYLEQVGGESLSHERLRGLRMWLDQAR